MKLFSKQLSTIYKNQETLSSTDENTSKYPQLHQFLFMVDVEDDIIKVLFMQNFNKDLSNTVMLTIYQCVEK